MIKTKSLRDIQNVIMDRRVNCPTCGYEQKMRIRDKEPHSLVYCYKCSDGFVIYENGSVVIQKRFDAIAKAKKKEIPETYLGVKICTICGEKWASCENKRVHIQRIMEGFIGGSTNPEGEWVSAIPHTDGGNNDDEDRGTDYNADD